MIDAEQLGEDFDDTAADSTWRGAEIQNSHSATQSLRPDYRPLEWSEDDESFPFIIDEWSAIEAKALSPRIMSRHFLITGETGSGKTVSAVKPLLRSALAYRASEAFNRTSLLVIDPKHELQQIVRDECAPLERPTLMLGQAGSPRVRLFEGFAGRSAAASVSYALSLCSPAFVQSRGAMEAYWKNSALQIITCIFAAREAASKFGDINFREVLRIRATLPEALKAIEMTPAFNVGDNFFAVDLAFCHLIMSHPSILQPFAILCRDLGMEPREYAKLTSLLDAPPGQRASELSTALLYLTDLAEADLNRCVDLAPAWFPSSGTASVRDSVEDGVAIVFSPDLGSSGAEVAGRVLKTKYFEAAFCRSNKHRPMFYICDEFQRFITSDPESGEQAFLDRCRAYRVTCVLATQSLAAIKNRLAQQNTSHSSDVDATLNILLGNTGNKLFFRSTERETLEAVARLMPHPRRGGLSAVQLCPPSQLGVGECYYVFADGAAGRGRVTVGPVTPNAISGPSVLVRLLGSIDMPTALVAQDSMVEATTVLLAREVEIELDVRGGDASAVRHFTSILGQLRDRGLRIATTGLATATGGGALILSLGDVGRRSAHPYCQLHYRSTAEDPRLDPSRTENKLEGIFDAFATSEVWGHTLARHLFGQYGYPDGQVVIDFADPVIAALRLGYSGIHTFDANSYVNLYRRLCAYDRPISTIQAIRLGLLDRVCD